MPRRSPSPSAMRKNPRFSGGSDKEEGSVSRKRPGKSKRGGGGDGGAVQLPAEWLNNGERPQTYKSSSFRASTPPRPPRGDDLAATSSHSRDSYGNDSQKKEKKNRGLLSIKNKLKSKRSKKGAPPLGPGYTIQGSENGSDMEDLSEDAGSGTYSDSGRESSQRGRRRWRRNRQKRYNSESPQPTSSRPAANTRSVSFDAAVVNYDRGGDRSSSGQDLEYVDYGYGDPPPPPPPPPPQQSEGERIRHFEANQKTMRVKPFHAFSQATYMSETEIYENMMLRSESAEFLTSYLCPTTNRTKKLRVNDKIRRLFGSPNDDGRIGSLRVEVLGCVGLSRHKPDVAVYLVCGDSAFSTDVISSCRSPMWPNNSHRACVFPLHHAFARLYVGVFDTRVRKNKENDVFCGRVSVDLAALRPNTEYDCTFPLRASTFVYERHSRGVVRLRFTLHFFSERAAVMSYFKRAKNYVQMANVKGYPTIPCADPKTFRNVAVTLYGQDLPGKYTKNSFRATMREFNLYQQNLRYLVKTQIVDTVLYERPLISLYLFLACMHCIYMNSVRMVPPYYVGYIIYLFIDNYLCYNVSQAGTLGYKPLTIREVLYALLFDGKGTRGNFKPLLAKKKAKQSKYIRSSKDDDGEILPMNHREFPFSDKMEYKKFSAEEALVSSVNRSHAKTNNASKENVGRMRGRLSIYMAPVEVEAAPQEPAPGSDKEESSAEDSDKDDESVVTVSQLGDDPYDLDEDASSGDEEVLDKDEGDIDLLDSGSSSLNRRIRVGPPQNNDHRSRRVPPQVHLAKIEKNLHKVTKSVAFEPVHVPLTMAGREVEKKDVAKNPENKIDGTDVDALMKKKKHYDEFDRLLGLQTRTANPVLRITGSFLGPLMRIIRVFLFCIRVSFNVTTWRDPYLSCLVLVVLSLLSLILVVFPWRSFLFLFCLLGLGPQNIFLRRYLERKARKREEEKKREEEEKKKQEMAQSYGYESQAPTSNYGYEDQGPSQNYGYENNAPQGSQQMLDQSESSFMEDRDSGKKKNVFQNILFQKKEKQRDKRRGKKDENTLTLGGKSDEGGERVGYVGSRPPFSATGHKKTSTAPRSVVVPYSRLRKERFYDWPPDPTVSRATPISLQAEDGHAVEEAEIPPGSNFENQNSTLYRRRDVY